MSRQRFEPPGMHRPGAYRPPRRRPQRHWWPAVNRYRRRQYGRMIGGLYLDVAFLLAILGALYFAGSRLFGW